MILCVIFLGLGIVSLRSVAALVVVRTSGAAIRTNERDAHSVITIRLLKAIQSQRVEGNYVTHSTHNNK